MSRGFAWCMLLVALFLLFLPVVVRGESPKPYMILLWGTIGLACCYKLFVKK